MTIPMSDARTGKDDPRQRPEEGNGKVLRLHCPFCRAEYPLWLRPEDDPDATMSPAEWERWLDSACRECGRKPREHVTRS